jgi:FkbM family methyltransferase
VRGTAPGSEVHAFEANPQIHAKHRERLQAQGVQYWNLAITDHVGDVVLYAPRTLSRAYIGGEVVPASIVEGEDTGKTSLLRRNEEATYAEFKVEATTLDAFADAHLPDWRHRAIFLWVDVEGAGDRVFAGGKRLLSRTRAIFLETEGFEFWKDQADCGAIVSQLLRAGFLPVARDREYGDKQFNILFVPRACRPYRAKTKGKVERPFRYIREDFFLASSFRNLEDLNGQLRHWLDAVANQRVHATTRRVVNEAFAEEINALKLPLACYQAVLRPERHVSHEGMVCVGGNLYSVPDTTRQPVLDLHVLADAIRICEDGVLIACHAPLEGRGEKRLDPAHRKMLAHRIDGQKKQVQRSLRALGHSRSASDTPLATTPCDRLAQREGSWGVRSEASVSFGAGARVSPSLPRKILTETASRSYECICCVELLGEIGCATAVISEHMASRTRRSKILSQAGAHLRFRPR